MRLRISPLCVFTWRDGQMVCDNPVLRRQLALSAAAQDVLRHFADWTEVEAAAGSGPSGPDPRLVRQLHEARVLVEEDSPEHRLGADPGPWSQWGTAATYYHLATRTAADEPFLTAAEDTAWLRDRLPGRPQPPETKEYPDAEQFRLSPPGPLDGLGAQDLGTVLRARRTTRSFDLARPVPERTLSTLLHWVAGSQHQVSAPGQRPSLLRTSPSGGARHSLEVYPVVLNVEGVPSGIHHYHPIRHVLEQLTGPVDLDQVVAWCGGQTYLRGAGVLFLYTSVLDRVGWKYRMPRTYRTLFMELGHFSQTGYLVGTALGLGAFFTAATRDAAVEDALGLDWRREILLGVNGFGIPTAQEAERQRAMLDGGEPAFSFAGDGWDGLGA
ncbi:SagB/ThcOx family dehydrogenase [Streptomyces virginiae]|uniref:SagB/ThcOx family dehydrogenase n=1 Tax=Streptomyces virginiae TaxID=1961 RepID=UPI0036E103D5